MQVTRRACVCVPMQNACLKYSAFLRRLITDKLMPLAELQASFYSLIGRLHDMSQVIVSVMLKVMLLK